MILSIPPVLAFIEGLGGGEMILIFFIILILFGGKRLPELARGLGKSVREFKKATAGVEDEIKRALDDREPVRPATRKAPLHAPQPAVIEPLDELDAGETPAAPPPSVRQPESDTRDESPASGDKPTP